MRKNGLEKLIEGVIGVAVQQYSLRARVHNVAGKVDPCVSLARVCVGKRQLGIVLGKKKNDKVHVVIRCRFMQRQAIETQINTWKE